MVSFSDIRAEIGTCIGFYTRIPVAETALPQRGFAAAQWAAPIAGAVVALSGWVVWQAAASCGLEAGPAAALALGAVMLVTGSLHEDGLADTADGLGGGRTRERKLEIMRDSRIGTYGAAALAMSMLLRWSALAEIRDGLDVLLALLAAHMMSRALIPAFLAVVPPARADGLSAGVGSVDVNTAAIAGLLGIGALCLLGLGAAVAAAVLLGAIFITFRRLCISQIGGQTGDTLGALQQFGEVAVLMVAAAVA